MNLESTSGFVTLALIGMNDTERLFEQVVRQLFVFGDVQLIVKPDVHMTSVNHVFDPTTKLPVPSTLGLTTQTG